MRSTATWLFPQHANCVLRAAAAIALFASTACSDDPPAAMSPATSAMVPAAGVRAQPAAGSSSAAGASAGVSGASTPAAGSGGAAGATLDGGMRDAARLDGSVTCRVPDNLPVTEEDADGGVDPKCRDIPRTIFAENCIGGFCHNARERPSGNLDLMSPCVADRLLDRSSTCEDLLLIDRAHVERSFLLDKLQNMKPRCGASMPDGWHLPPDQVACVTAWVNAVIRAAR